MFFIKIKKWIFSHKKISLFLIIALVFGGYKVWASFNQDEGTTEYLTAIAEKGEIVSSVTGTGQVSASNRVDVVAEVSGDVVSVPVKLGNPVSKGATLAYLDSRDASRAVENAELSLENAKISYEKAKKQAADQTEGSSISDINKSYEDGYTAVSNAMIDIPDIVSGTDDIFYNPSHSAYFGDVNIRSTAGETAITYKYEAGRMFDRTKADYQKIFLDYKKVKVSNREDLVALIEDTYSAVKALHSSLVSTYNTIDYIKQRTDAENVPAEIATDKNYLNSAIAELSGHMTSLSNALTDIEDAKDSSTEATLDLKSAELAVSKAEDDLRNAKEDLANHAIRAPFSGVVGKVDVEVGDKISSNGAVATIITDEKLAEVSLNEVDIAKIENGQKASVTFDAIDDLKISGTVSEIDLLGTVNQGVVSYTVKIAFDSNDDRIKTGMSLSASIFTEKKEGVVRVPNSAVKSRAGMSYVERKNVDGSIVQIPVRVGISNDEFSEIVSGLNEGESFVVRTISGSSNASATQAPSIFGGTRGAGTGGARFQAR